VKRLLVPFLLIAVGFALPAGGARAASPSLAYGNASGYQIAISGSGWNPQTTITFTLLKGSLGQSIDLRPAADGTFEVGMNDVNICGLTFYNVRNAAGDSVTLHSPGVMCMANYVPPSPGTAVLTVLDGQSTAPRPGPSLAPRPLLSRYFADLNAHRYARALALESDCAVSFSPSPNGSQTQTIRLATAAPYRPSALAFIRSTRIVHISRFTVPALSAATLAAYHVSGTFQFAGAPSPSAGLSSGYHRFTVIVRQCGGRWTVDPAWFAAAAYSWL
jgi:hypothetical protein